MNIKFLGLVARLSMIQANLACPTSSLALSQSRTPAPISAHLSPGPQKGLLLQLLAWAPAGAPARSSLYAKLCLSYWILTGPL